MALAVVSRCASGISRGGVRGWQGGAPHDLSQRSVMYVNDNNIRIPNYDTFFRKGKKCVAVLPPPLPPTLSDLFRAGIFATPILTKHPGAAPGDICNAVDDDHVYSLLCWIGPSFLEYSSPMLMELKRNTARIMEHEREYCSFEKLCITKFVFTMSIIHSCLHDYGKEFRWVDTL